QRKSAIATTVALILCALCRLGFQTPRGILTNTDELVTAERTREMLDAEPWVVHYNFQRSFEKPPLQYWLTTLTLPRLQNRTLAVRIWPLLYGGLTMVALGWLVFLVEPNRPWLLPSVAPVLPPCPYFSWQRGAALLDAGWAF